MIYYTDEIQYTVFHDHLKCPPFLPTASKLVHLLRIPTITPLHTPQNHLLSIALIPPHPIHSHTLTHMLWSVSMFPSQLQMDEAPKNIMHLQTVSFLP